MQKIGDNLYEITGKSGQPIIGKPNTGDKGKIVAGSLEQSNVDIAKEFTNMILVQRAFQANSKVITTSDIMLDDLIRMKR
ncbi:MAG: Flagellar hook protein FlgE [Candidatus Methanoperedenaceae archaeon GB37]|nr:MAG: Flagellar hook protein FlgE [Candidatus Methanoperedenaceae archaeon GB37]